ncbi:uncharacterized protein METZ01_LOCUS402154 [marine metagenome]|uniref:Uncharacterized protein n=1 Tax=marine metagenome TaxID=408172 RepID=A0A382VSF0_9ZZZZ
MRTGINEYSQTSERKKPATLVAGS